MAKAEDALAGATRGQLGERLVFNTQARPPPAQTTNHRERRREPGGTVYP